MFDDCILSYTAGFCNRNSILWLDSLQTTPSSSSSAFAFYIGRLVCCGYCDFSLAQQYRQTSRSQLAQQHYYLLLNVLVLVPFYTCGALDYIIASFESCAAAAYRSQRHRQRFAINLASSLSDDKRIMPVKQPDYSRIMLYAFKSLLMSKINPM